MSAFLADPERVLIADASVVIGLNASGYARQILELMPCRVLVPENARDELTIGAQFGHDDSAQLDALIDAGLVSRVSLGEPEHRTFETLIDGTFGNTLDDGEAATIAIAIEYGGVAILDERKARRMCGAHFPGLLQACTAQLLLEVRALGKAAQAEAMINALRKGRMRVPPEILGDVVELIGLEAAAACRSLPRVTRVGGSKESE